MDSIRRLKNDGSAGCATSVPRPKTRKRLAPKGMRRTWTLETLLRGGNQGPLIVGFQQWITIPRGGTMKVVWRDQDGNPVPTPPDDVTAAMLIGAVLLGPDAKPLPGDSAPHYLVFQTDTDKQIRILNVNSGSQDHEAR